MPRGLEQCLQALTAAHGLSEEQALDILQQVKDRADELRKTGTPDAEMAAAGKLADEFRAKATSNRIAAINSVLRRVALADESSAAEQRIAAVSANSPPLAGRITRVPWGPYLRQKVKNAPAKAQEMLTGEYWNAPNAVGAPRRPPVFGEPPTGIRMENLHPEDQAEIARADDAIARANDMRAGYEAAAQCLTGAGL
jgi:hypothetical protein